MSQIHFSEDHEWVRVEDGIGTVGVTQYAQKALGDIVYVELPETGATLKKGGEAGVVESVKAASEVYAPVSGEVVGVNDSLPDSPAKVNEDPEGEAWFFKIRLSDTAELTGLMDGDAYRTYVAGLE